MADTEVTEVRRLIDGLRRNPRRHPYHGRREHSDRAREVAVALAGMLDAGRAADVVPLARRAVERATDGLLHIDDSFGIIGDDLRELTGLFAKACAIAPPDAAKLAAWLVAARCDGPGWLQLISLRQSEHPADVLGPLSRLIELGVEQADDKYRYPKAVKALRRLRVDYERAGDAAGFGVYLAGLRERQRRKYSFIAKLDATFGTEGS